MSFGKGLRNNVLSIVVYHSHNFFSNFSVGRVTNRLPQDLADEVIGSILELFDILNVDGRWHGGKTKSTKCLLIDCIFHMYVIITRSIIPLKSLHTFTSFSFSNSFNNIRPKLLATFPHNLYREKDQ